MAVTIREVARQAGVSQATAARALGGYGYVGDDARQRVLSGRPQPRLPAEQRRPDLGLGHLEHHRPRCRRHRELVFRHGRPGLADVVEEFGYTLIIANSDEDIVRERRAVDSLRANRVDGLVVAPANSSDGAHLAEASGAGTPIVLVDRTVRGLAVDSVVSDGISGAGSGVRHLVSLGHRRIGLVIDATSTPLSSLTMRMQGWAGTLRAAGLRADDSLIVHASSPLETATRRPSS